jgi:hypothetical protein
LRGIIQNLEEFSVIVSGYMGNLLWWIAVDICPFPKNNVYLLLAD